MDWHWDDANAVPHEELLIRRVRRIPDCVVTNLTTLQPELKTGALIFDAGSGMSVHQDSLRDELGVDRGEVCDWESYHAITFAAEIVRDARCEVENTVRQVGGVIHEADPDDDVLGPAHALVRTRTSSLPRRQKQAVRDRIIDNYKWLPEDPNRPGS